MKLFGVLIITAGFITSSLASVMDKAQINWQLFIIGLVASIIGIVILKINEKKTAKSGDVINQNIQVIEKSLSSIASNIKMLDDQKHDTFVYDFCQKIDDLFLEDINRFVEARQSIPHAYGLAAYADIMTSFAAAERYLNRVWSASADGYVDEANTYIEKSRKQFEESLEKLNTYRGSLKSDRVTVSSMA